MTDLNLDGLPNLQTCVMHLRSDQNVAFSPDGAAAELRQLVASGYDRGVRDERDRWLRDEGEVNIDGRPARVVTVIRERLPSWARPVLRAAVAAVDEGDGILEADIDLAEAVDVLTPAQRAEIERDDG
jgi:hypothetical protein